MTETFESIKKRKMRDLGSEPEIPDGKPNLITNSDLFLEVHIIKK